MMIEYEKLIELQKAYMEREKTTLPVKFSFFKDEIVVYLDHDEEWFPLSELDNPKLYLMCIKKLNELKSTLAHYQENVKFIPSQIKRDEDKIAELRDPQCAEEEAKTMIEKEIKYYEQKVKDNKDFEIECNQKIERIKKSIKEYETNFESDINAK